MNVTNYFLRKEESFLLLNKERTVTIEKKMDRKKYSLKLLRFRIILSLTYRAKEQQSCL